jgi:hypothetical protein
MRIKPLHNLLLVAALVLGQGLGVAHDYQHPALDGDETCQVCLHGPNFQAGPATAAVLTTLWLTDETPLAQVSGPVLNRRHSHAAIRAPPALLV